MSWDEARAQANAVVFERFGKVGTYTFENVTTDTGEAKAFVVSSKSEGMNTFTGAAETRQTIAINLAVIAQPRTNARVVVDGVSYRLDREVESNGFFSRWVVAKVNA